jgi:hypothetical protein
MFYSSCYLGGTSEQPEDDPLCSNLFAEETTRDNVVMLMALYYFGMTSVRGALKYLEKNLKRHTSATFSDTNLACA